MSSSAFAIVLAGLSFVMTVIWGVPLLRLLRYFKIAERIKVFSTTQDFTRLGTPSMGGFLIIVPVTLVTLLLNIVTLTGIPVLGQSIFLPLLTMLTFSSLGVIDDLYRLRRINTGHLRLRTRLFVQLIISIPLAYGLQYVLDVPQMFFPFWKGEIELGYWYIPVAIFVILSTTNAVHTTRGMDGLSGLVSVIAFGCFGSIALFQGQIYLARFCFTVVGALFGFLWFNVKPAALIMGSTGTYALGGALGVVALMTAQWILLPLIAVIPFLDTLSILIQFYYYRLTKGGRFFRMTPLHFHFEMVGWSDTQVVQRFWLINLLFAAIGITLAIA